MSNHFYLVVYFDPMESFRWSDEEVAERGLRVFSPGVNVASETDRTALFNLHPNACFIIQLRVDCVPLP